jgi:hypothetical protein
MIFFTCNRTEFEESIEKIVVISFLHHISHGWHVGKQVGGYTVPMGGGVH